MENAKEDLQQRTDRFVHAMHALDIHDFKMIMFQANFGMLLLANWYLPPSEEKAVLITDHNTRVGGVYLVCHRENRMDFLPLGASCSLQEALTLAHEKGWPVGARHFFPEGAN